MTSQEGIETYACSLTEVGPTGRHRVKVNDRDIVIVQADQEIYALDSYCYHAGGPLYNGDELGGRLCIVCPWHKYKVCLNTGQNYYQAVDPHNLQKPPVWQAGEVRQRTHKVSVRDGKIFVSLSSQDRTLDSDRYNDKREEEI